MDKLLQIVSGFMEAKVLLAGAELGVFDHFGRDGATAAEVARALAGDPRGTEILLDALVSIEVLRKESGRYHNLPEFEPFLLADGPAHFLGLLRHRNRMFRTWAILEDRITGKQPVDPNRELLEDRESNANFIQAMYAGGMRQAPAVIDRLGLEGVRVAADLGGGPGHYLAEMARRSPSLEPYLVDLPLTLEVARKILAPTAIFPRLHFVEWDFYRVPQPPPLPAFDLVLVSAVLHAESPDHNRDLLKRIFPLVAPGGRVVVQENLVEGDRTQPKEAALFAINMLTGTPGGRTYTEAEIRCWGEQAGFRFAGCERLTPRSSLLTLRRE
jgi:3-hydroxy-5-methyl-1-naphthoate 3-O-methyltransferase